MVTQVTQYVRTSYVPMTFSTNVWGSVYCLPPSPGVSISPFQNYGCVTYWTPVTDTTYVPEPQLALTTYEEQNTATIPYIETVSCSITESSTGLVPASAALGLSDGSFTALAIVVIGILAFLTA